MKAQYRESSAIRMEIGGRTPSGQIIIMITNKQSCTSGVLLNASINLGSTISRTKTIASGVIDTFNLSLSGLVFLDGRPLTNCGDFTDLDELNPISFQIDVDALPIHFKSFEVQKVSDWVYRVTFVIDDLTNADHINIQVSKDSLTWRTVEVVMPKDIQLGKPYSLDVNVQ